ncbi:hypothetical protein PLESTB_000851800 [Pleodorina starrii]|uniref:Uncharacterized protein n=1 Tax=Pleodorina starrii TaxID=330485 RepID=A0A9W6F2M0_9CHLO|nr:hypothetical protein PLESTB_000851800 [Pleodorina starrii]GLC71979.1 hypothetical protein PLESTF_001191400 [Pleodorina starrii]
MQSQQQQLPHRLPSQKAVARPLSRAAVVLLNLLLHHREQLLISQAMSARLQAMLTQASALRAILETALGRSTLKADEPSAAQPQYATAAMPLPPLSVPGPAGAVCSRDRSHRCDLDLQSTQLPVSDAGASFRVTATPRGLTHSPQRALPVLHPVDEQGVRRSKDDARARLGPGASRGAGGASPFVPIRTAVEDGSRRALVAAPPVEPPRQAPSLDFTLGGAAVLAAAQQQQQQPPRAALEMPPPPPPAWPLSPSLAVSPGGSAAEPAGLLQADGGGGADGVTSEDVRSCGADGGGGGAAAAVAPTLNPGALRSRARWRHGSGSDGSGSGSGGGGVVRAPRERAPSPPCRPAPQPQPQLLPLSQLQLQLPQLPAQSQAELQMKVMELLRRQQPACRLENRFLPPPPPPRAAECGLAASPPWGGQQHGREGLQQGPLLDLDLDLQALQRTGFGAAAAGGKVPLASTDATSVGAAAAAAAAAAASGIPRPLAAGREASDRKRNRATARVGADGNSSSTSPKSPGELPYSAVASPQQLQLPQLLPLPQPSSPYAFGTVAAAAAAAAAATAAAVASFGGLGGAAVLGSPSMELPAPAAAAAAAAATAAGEWRDLPPAVGILPSAAPSGPPRETESKRPRLTSYGSVYDTDAVVAAPSLAALAQPAAVSAAAGPPLSFPVGTGTLQEELHAPVLLGGWECADAAAAAPAALPTPERQQAAFVPVLPPLGDGGVFDGIGAGGGGCFAGSGSDVALGKVVARAETYSTAAAALGSGSESGFGSGQGQGQGQFAGEWCQTGLAQDVGLEEQHHLHLHIHQHQQQQAQQQMLLLQQHQQHLQQQLQHLQMQQQQLLLLQYQQQQQYR